MSDIVENFKNGWLNEDPRLVAAVLLGIFTFVILNILLYKSEKHKKVLKQQAIENNTAIKGYLVYRRYNYSSEDDTPYYARYRYTVNGKKKEYSIDSSFSPPDTIELYPKNNSMTKFFSDYDRTPNAGVAFNAIAGIAVCMLILWITGYIF